MKFSYPGIDNVFSTEEYGVNCLVIENRKFYAQMLDDISAQLQGCRGKAVLMVKDGLADLAKNAELLISFFPFDINRKTLLSKIAAEIERKAQTAEYYERTSELTAAIERYLNDITVDFSCDLIYNKLSVSSLVKSAGIEIADDSTSLAEKLLDYMQLSREFEGNKLFITVNLRSFIDDDTLGAFFESVISHKYDLLMVENCSYPIITGEKRFTVDEDLCCF